MCKCNPLIKGPYCGEGDCVRPPQEKLIKDITYTKRTGYEVECRNCSYKIILKDEPCGGDEVVCANCKSEYIITEE